MEELFYSRFDRCLEGTKETDALKMREEWRKEEGRAYIEGDAVRQRKLPAQADDQRGQYVSGRWRYIPDNERGAARRRNDVEL